MDDLIKELATTIVTVAAATLAPLVVAIAVRLLKKVGLEVSGVQQSKTEHLVRQAILQAEETVESQLKRVVGSTKVTANNEKLKLALTTVLHKVPGISVAEAEALIKAELPKIGLGAAGASFLRAVRESSTNPPPPPAA